MVAGSPERDRRKLHARVEKGNRAAEEFADPLLQEALDDLEKEIELGWKSSAADDQEGRDNAYKLHRLLLRLRAWFKERAVSGSNARALLQDLEQQESGGRSQHSRA